MPQNMLVIIHLRWMTCSPMHLYFVCFRDPSCVWMNSGKWKINICDRHSANDLRPSSNPEHPPSRRSYDDWSMHICIVCFRDPSCVRMNSGKWKINICDRHSANDLGLSSNPEHPGSKRLYHD